MNLFWDGDVFNFTGLATAYRGLIKELYKQRVKIQLTDNYRKDFNPIFLEMYKNLEDPIIIRGCQPIFWKTFRGIGKKVIGCCMNEVSKLHEEWVQNMNNLVSKVIVPSDNTKKIFIDNNVKVPIEIVPFGVDPKIYNPKGDDLKKELNLKDEFCFLFLNSWTGDKNCRKGTDILLEAFFEEFKDENVTLLFKVSNFWMPPFNIIRKIQELGINTSKIRVLNPDIYTEEILAKLYRTADCFVAPSKGESFALTILEAMSCDVPVITTNYGGHLDYCKDFAYLIDIEKEEQADPRLYIEGAKWKVPDKAHLRKLMREVFENSDKAKKRAKEGGTFVRKNFTWEKAAKKFIEVIE